MPWECQYEGPFQQNRGVTTCKTLWEEKFTGKQDLCESVNIKNFGRRKVRKHKEIKGSDKCVTLNIYEILNIS